METTTKEGTEMLTYSVRCDYSDGTFDVVEVSGVESPAAAAQFCREHDSEIEQTTVVGSVDNAPQVGLVAVGGLRYAPEPSSLSSDELLAAQREIEREIERRRNVEIGARPAGVEPLADELDFVDTRWAEEYQGELLHDEEAEAAVRWLWSNAVIGHESQHERAPSVRWVADRIGDALASLVFAEQPDTTMFDERS